MMTPNKQSNKTNKLSNKHPTQAKQGGKATEGEYNATPYAYVPTAVGSHKIEILYNGKPIPGSAFNPEIEERPAALCKAYGEGLSTGTVGDEATFTVDVPDRFPKDKLAVACSGPAGESVSVKSEAGAAEGFHRFACAYVPQPPGAHKIPITYEGEDSPGSVFEATVEQRSLASRSRAFGALSWM